MTQTCSEARKELLFGKSLVNRLGIDPHRVNIHLEPMSYANICDKGEYTM